MVKPAQVINNVCGFLQMKKKCWTTANATEYYSTFKIMNSNAASFIHIIFFKS